MGSLSRPQQRRKHTASNGVSTKNPYGDVVLSNGGKRKVFEAREYTEIFGGSSSIPVLDLSSLDERVGSGEWRSSKLDYSGVFGGVRNDEVAVPYEVLVNGSSVDKSNPRVLAGGHSSSKDSGSQHSSRKVKRATGEVAGQSVGGVKPPLILSSNSISRTNGDASNEKKHEASTHFVNGAPHLPKIDNDRPQPPRKHEVSRTWSFSAGVGTVSKSGPSPGKSHDSSKLSDANEVNLKTQSFEFSPMAIHYSNLCSSKGPRQANAPFSSEDDNSGKPAGLWSPPSFEEEFDENSPAAVSAAALKKAIDQAQECIRIAKMIMERKEDGRRYGSKSRRRGCWNDLETKVDEEAYASNECNSGKEDEKSGPLFSPVDGKSSPPISRNNTFVNAVNAGVQRGSKIPELTKAEPEMRDKNLEANVTHAETTVFPGFNTNEDLRTPKSGHGKVHSDSGFMLSTTVLASILGGQESVDQNKWKEPEVLAEVEEKQGLVSFERLHELERMTEETGQSNTNSDQVKSPENIIELVESSHEQENVACEAVENFRISTADEVIDRNDECANVMEKNDKKFNELEIIDGEHLTCVSSKFGNLSAESCNVVGYEMPEQKEMDKKFQNYFECKENVYTDEQNEWRMEEKEALLLFESKEQQEEPLEKKFNEEELDAFPEIDGVQQKVTEAFEPEFVDQKQNHADGAHAPNLPGKYNQSEVEESFIPTSECETAEAVVVDEEDGADAQKSECDRDAHVINIILDGARKSKEDGHNFEMQQAEYEERMDETVDVNGGDDIDIGKENHVNDISTLSNQFQEACDGDFHKKAEDDQEPVQSNREHSCVPEVTEAISPTDKDELEELGMEVNEMRGIESLHRTASDDIFIENKLHNSFDGLSSDSEEKGDVLIMHADPEEKENEDKDAFNPVTEILDSAQEYAADLPGVFQSEPGTGEVDIKNAKKMPEQTSKCNGESPSDGSSAHNSEGYPQDDASIKDEKKDEVETFPNESTSPEEQSQATPDLSSESEENERSTEAGKAVETSLNMEKDKENIVETSTAEEKDAKEDWQGYDGNDQQQRIEAIRRGREREKEKLAAERAIREARERAFAEARERAERAAVERASAEARKRYLAEAQEKHERVAMEKQQADKASAAKLRAERAAVERATAEARERAIGKAMSHKTTTKARPQVERSQTDRWSNSARNDGLKHSLSSSDLDSALNTESAQRTKARFEKNQRIADRVAQALEEKNKRDRLVQKEQAERDRIAEYLDADIKRWSMGKEGNLRALLSTLHYILGADSGWQPIPLTEIITTPAVKKAYRKATLCVHPDKLQQRGATIQQKYICEKIFDLLKAAWNRFNSEER